jgi:TetR/AcrR family transcriptional regulator, transcriptional repressor for nem operon
MRRSREEAARTRRGIVAAASRLFRARGVAEVSVANVMGAVGLTVGGFYRHFSSKASLVGEAIEQASEETMGRFRDGPGGPPRFDALLEAYLSSEHRAEIGGGCPVAALCSEIAREDRPTRAAFTVALRRMLALVAEVIPGSAKNARREQLHAAAAAVGALVLARASDDQDLGNEILAAVRHHLLADRRRGANRSRSLT